MTTAEQETLLDVLDALDGCGYGVTIRRALSVQLGRDVNLGELYVALEQLEEAGLVRSALGEATPKRGGRAKKHFWRA
jgi:PadR family transcriptional regulator, regulatory protein PadR